ncbi:response regulator [Desulfovibrio sp. OttesenSCG-928-I05]|nr:response regulator [Desulfovibrio sp. OttesenSCG-928-I05]
MRSLRAKLILPFILGTLSLTLLLVWYTYSSARKAMEDAMIIISESKTNHAASSMALLFKSASSSVQNLVADPHVISAVSPETRGRASWDQATEWLETLTQSNEYYRDLLIVDRSGVCVASSNPGHTGVYFGDSPHVIRALGGMYTFGEPSVGKVTKKLSITVAGPVDTEHGIMGAFTMVYDLPSIVDYKVNDSFDSQTISTALLAPNGFFAAHKDMSIMGNKARTYPDLYKALLAAAGERGERVQYVMDDEEYIGYAKMDPSSRWMVVTSGKEGEVFAPATRTGGIVLAISLFFLVVISLLVLPVANRLLSSLFSLVGYAKKVSEGELEEELIVKDRNDELGTLQDALKSLVMSLRRMLLETQEASRMKGQFLANMSHEIRTPLNVILGLAHLSLRDGGMSEKQRGYMEKTQMAAKSLLGLINDVLDISKVEAGMLSMDHIPFNLRETAENTLAIHTETAQGKGIILSLDYDSQLPEFFIGDPLRIGQVLNNLLSNALKFTSRGEVAVTCRLDRDAVPEAPGTVGVVCSVKDSGIGMSPETCEKLFQPFTQADASITRQFGGTGLGLAISARLVALMHGEFTVSSIEGEGSTFSFSMVLEQDSSNGASLEAEEISEATFEQLGIQGKRILIAEDNPLNQLIIQELIAPSGADMTVVDNGQEAVEAIKAGRYDLVLMDMQMPVMGGLEATRIIRTLPGVEELPIIAFTANAMDEDKVTGLAGGMTDYLTKPVEPARLLRMLRVWLADR